MTWSRAEGPLSGRTCSSKAVELRRRCSCLASNQRREARPGQLPPAPQRRSPQSGRRVRQRRSLLQRTLLHADPAERAAYLASLTPGADLDLRGTTIVGDLLNRILTRVADPATGRSMIGTARFETATFTGDAVFHGAAFTGVAGFSGVAFTGRARFNADHAALRRPRSGLRTGSQSGASTCPLPSRGRDDEAPVVGQYRSRKYRASVVTTGTSIRRLAE